MLASKSVDLLCRQTFIRSVIPLGQLGCRGHLNLISRSLRQGFPKEKMGCLLCPLTRANENIGELGRVDQVASTDNDLGGTQDLLTPFCRKTKFCITSVSSILAPFRLTLERWYCQRILLGCCERLGFLPWRTRNTLGVPESLSFMPSSI